MPLIETSISAKYSGTSVPMLSDGLAVDSRLFGHDNNTKKQPTPAAIIFT